MQVDLLIHARWLIPIVPEDVVYEYYSLVINQGKIIALLPTCDAKQQYQATTVEQLDNHLVTAGFINSHTHASMSLMRGIADDLPLMEWLQEHIWPLEQQWMSEAFVEVGTELAIAEMIRSGTTCFNDMYFFPDIVAQQAIKIGIRASVGLIVTDFPTVWAEDSDEYVKKGVALLERYQDEPLITLPFAPHAPYTVSDKPLKTIADLSQQFQNRVHIHLHETQHEIEMEHQNTQQTPLQRLDGLGLLNSSLIAVHMTQLTAADIQLVADREVHIVHCPESNLKLASGFCPVAQCIEAGINVALGTDGAASNNDLDLLAEMRTAALLAKGVAGDASAVSAMTALKMATINGAKALGLENTIGSIEVGKSADIIAINLDELETLPLYHPISQLVYATNSRQVSDVWVAGQSLLKQGQLTTIDVKILKQKIAEWQQRLLKF